MQALHLPDYDKSQEYPEFEKLSLHESEAQNRLGMKEVIDGQRQVRKQWAVRIGVSLTILLLLLLVFQLFLPQSSQDELAQPILVTSQPHINSQKGQQIKVLSVNNQQANEQDQVAQNSPSSQKEFRRILWLQTDHELETKHMDFNLVAQNLIYFAKQAEYEVRIVNNLNAYDWLSEESIAFIKETHQKSKIDLNVYELLRLALLYEHGGVSLRLPNVMMLESLDWVENLLQGKVSPEDEGVLSCKSYEGVEMVVLHQEREGGTYGFKDDFMAAKPKARLLKTLLSEIASIVKEGAWPYPDNNIVFIDGDTAAVNMPRITQNLITVFRRQQSDLCQIYGMQSFHESKGTFMKAVTDDKARSTLTLNEKEFAKAEGKRFLLKLTMEKLMGDFAYVVKTGDVSSAKGSLLLNKLMTLEANRWLTIPVKKTRDVHFCIVSLSAQHLENYELEIKAQLGRLAKQTFVNWNLVNFAKNLPSAYKNVSEQVVLVNASLYEGLNLQRAATKYCDPASVMLLLDYDEALDSEKDLETLANHFEPIGVFAAFLNLKTSKTMFSPSATKGEIQRKINEPNEVVINEIGNLLRAFTVQMYRFIAHFDLYHSSTGRYFDRQIPLLAMLELSEHFGPCENGPIVYQVRRLEELMSMPRQKVFTNITFNTNRIKKADLTRFEYFAKYRHRHLCGTINFYFSRYGSPELMAVFNDGREVGPVTQKGMPELIPRKIHQIWVKGAIPNFKKFLIQRARDTHPDYEHFFWSEDNITRENFPESYDLLQTLVQFDKKSPFNKMAMVADIARNEIIYRHGGFYMDTNFMVFANHTLDQFLSYSFVSAGELSPRSRMFRSNAFFGSTKNNPRLARIISHRSLSSRNHYLAQAARETGPGLLGRVQLGNEEQDPQYFQPAMEEFYPNFIHDDHNTNWNKCITPDSTPEDQILFRSPKRAYLKNCSKIYDYAYGLDYWDEGYTWASKRW